MKRKLLLLLFALLPATMTWADVEINETNFPDENFRNWVLKWPYGADGLLTEEEIAGINKIYLTGNRIQSLRGIEYFTALIRLECYNDQLAALDVSQNTALKYLSCVRNQLTALDFSHNTELQTLYCEDNQLTALDVSKNTKLQILSCKDNLLTALDVSHNTKLGSLSCDNNQLTMLDMSHNTKLTMLCCYSNQLTMLDVSGCTALSNLLCYSNQLTALDVSHNTKLKYLYCYDNQLTALDVSKNTALTSLDCYQNQIKGAAMDALVESLPTVSNGTLRVIYYENEQNVMTTVQVAAAKAKGWIPYECIGIAPDGSSDWQEYPGSEPGGATGDLNGDDKVDIADAVSILNLMAEGSNDSVADLNNDGKVDIADFVSVLNLMAGQ